MASIQTVQSIISDRESAITSAGFVTGIDKLWIPEMGWSDKEVGASVDPYDPQYLCAVEIFLNMFGSANKCWIHLAAEMQAGKTGVINTLIRMMFIASNYKKIIISPESIFIITGMNDNAWKQQTKERLPKSIHDNVYHSSGLHRVVIALERKASSPQGFRNIMIVLDESHIASDVSNLPNIIFDKMNQLCPVDKWSENNIRVITISATDPALILSITKYKETSKVVNLRTDNTYQSVEKLKAENRIHNTFSLSKYEDVERFVNITRTTYPTTPNRYHIIRVSSKKNSDIISSNLHRILGEDCRITEFNSTKKQTTSYQNDTRTVSECEEDINSILENEPDLPTFILVKNMFYASKTFKDTYCGILFDRSATSTKDDTIAQSFLGRACGYNRSKQTHVYTNISSVERYIKEWSKMKPVDELVFPDQLPKHIHKKMAGIVATPHEGGSKVSVSETRATPMETRNIVRPAKAFTKAVVDDDNFESIWSPWFTDENECKRWWKNTGGKQLPKLPKKNKDGFYECSWTKKGVMDVLDGEALKRGKKTINMPMANKLEVGKESRRKYHAYRNTNDNTTLEFCAHYIKRIA